MCTRTFFSLFCTLGVGIVFGFVMGYLHCFCFQLLWCCLLESLVASGRDVFFYIACVLRTASAGHLFLLVAGGVEFFAPI